jgi:hydrogenase 3 maturation protease
MSLNSWQTTLNLFLSQQSAKRRMAIVGIGNTLRGDDAAGILVARALMSSPFIRDLATVRVIDASYAPENSTAELRRFAPDRVLFIDAAEMHEIAGTIRWIEMDELDGMSASTHTLPLSMLAKYLTLELKCKVTLLGIQPASNEVGETVSIEVTRAANTVVEALVGALSLQPVL